MANRTPRDLETREKTTRAAYVPPSVLPEPTPEPGYSYRWIATHVYGTADPSNVSKKTREGWEPVRVEEQPKFKLLVDPESRFKDNIEIGGLLLCKTPQELVDQRTAYYENQTQAQTDAVDNNLMRQNDPRMPLFNERKSSTSFGKG